MGENTVVTCMGTRLGVRYTSCHKINVYYYNRLYFQVFTKLDQHVI